MWTPIICKRIFTATTHHSLLRFDQGPTEAIHLGVQPTGIAEIVASPISSPQGGLDGATVDAFPALIQIIQEIYNKGRQEGWISMEVKREAQLKHCSAILLFPPPTSSPELPLQMQRGVSHHHHHCFIENITFTSQIVSITAKTSSVGKPHEFPCHQTHEVR